MLCSNLTKDPELLTALEMLGVPNRHIMLVNLRLTAFQLHQDDVDTKRCCSINFFIDTRNSMHFLVAAARIYGSMCHEDFRAEDFLIYTNKNAPPLIVDKVPLYSSVNKETNGKKQEKQRLRYDCSIEEHLEAAAAAADANATTNKSMRHHALIDESLLVPPTSLTSESAHRTSFCIDKLHSMLLTLAVKKRLNNRDADQHAEGLLETENYSDDWKHKDSVGCMASSRYLQQVEALRQENTSCAQCSPRKTDEGNSNRQGSQASVNDLHDEYELQGGLLSFSNVFANIQENNTEAINILLKRFHCVLDDPSINFYHQKDMVRNLCRRIRAIERNPHLATNIRNDNSVYNDDIYDNDDDDDDYNDKDDINNRGGGEKGKNTDNDSVDFASFDNVTCHCFMRYMAKHRCRRAIVLYAVEGPFEMLCGRHRATHPHEACLQWKSVQAQRFSPHQESSSVQKTNLAIEAQTSVSTRSEVPRTQWSFDFDRVYDYLQNKLDSRCKMGKQIVRIEPWNHYYFVSLLDWALSSRDAESSSTSSGGGGGGGDDFFERVKHISHTLTKKAKNLIYNVFVHEPNRRKAFSSAYLLMSTHLRFSFNLVNSETAKNAAALIFYLYYFVTLVDEVCNQLADNTYQALLKEEEERIERKLSHRKRIQERKRQMAAVIHSKSLTQSNNQSKIVDKKQPPTQSQAQAQSQSKAKSIDQEETKTPSKNNNTQATPCMSAEFLQSTLALVNTEQQLAETIEEMQTVFGQNPLSVQPYFCSKVTNPWKHLQFVWDPLQIYRLFLQDRLDDQQYYPQPVNPLPVYLTIPDTFTIRF